jgi:hypothetical protein
LEDIMKFCKTATVLITAVAIVSAGPLALANEPVAIILQKNGGTGTLFDEILTGSARTGAQRIIDAMAETFESIKTELQASGRYRKIINLTDSACTRANLKKALIDESVSAQTSAIDLFIYGHGGSNRLLLFNGAELTGGVNGNIRSLLTEARAERGAGFNFKLRLVYMCNCYGSSVNADWVAIGAKASVGSAFNNYMPEPMITNFINDFVNNNVPAKTAADNAWNLARVLYAIVPTYQTVDPANGNLNKIDQSKPVVGGPTPNLRHTTQRLSVNESRTVTVQAKETHNWPTLLVRKGERYSFTASGTWKNGSTSTGPAGYTPGILDGARRHSAYNMMTLVGELYTADKNPLTYTGRHFRVGTSATYTVPQDGFLGFFANDMIAAYFDNSGSTSLTIKRLQ